MTIKEPRYRPNVSPWCRVLQTWERQLLQHGRGFCWSGMCQIAGNKHVRWSLQAQASRLRISSVLPACHVGRSRVLESSSTR